MKPIAIIVHGFNVADGGDSTTDRLQPYLENVGFEVVSYDTAWTTGLVRDLLLVRSQNDERSQELADVITKYKQEGRKIVVIGHSNGATLTYLANALLADKGLKTADVLIYINPALKSDFGPPKGVKWMVVYFTPHDRPVLWGKLLSRLIPAKWRPWGAMGRYGYKGLSRQVININMERLYTYLTETTKKFDHNDFFEYENLDVYGDDMAKLIKSLL